MLSRRLQHNELGPCRSSSGHYGLRKMENLAEAVTACLTVAMALVVMMMMMMMMIDILAL